MTGLSLSAWSVFFYGDFMAEDYKSKKLTTPLVTLAWPYLGEPKQGGEYDGEFGVYKCDIVLDPANEDHNKFIKELESLGEWAKGEVKRVEGKSKVTCREVPVTEQLNKDKKPTGMMKLSVRLSAGGRDKNGKEFSRSLLVVGADRRPLPKSEASSVSAGSTAYVGLEAKPYFVAGVGGLSLKMKAVQVIDLVRYGAVEASDFFDVQEGFSSSSIQDDAEESDVPEVQEDHDF